MKPSDVKFLKMSRKDYESGRSNGIPIQNFPEYHDWVQKYYGRGVTRVMFDKACSMTGDNRAKFKKHFGKCAFTFNGEHYFHGWLVDLGTARVIVLTAHGHGTCYEVVTVKTVENGATIKEDIPRVLEFIDMITDLEE